MKRELIRLTQQLIRIDSSNPPGNEREIARFIKRYLKIIGLTSKMYEFKKNRPNVVCTIPSRRFKKKVLITPHIDTVPPSSEGKFPPFSGHIVGGKIYGRGATDNKGNVAVALYLLKLLQQEKVRLHNIDLVFAFTADEETGSAYGLVPLLDTLKGIDYAVVLDSDECEIVIVQKGLLHLGIEVFGKEAHGAYPHKGINAIEKSVYILNDILKESFGVAPHPLLKEPTINIGKICGGRKVNIVAGKSYWELDIRYIPALNKSIILKKIKAIIRYYNVPYTLKVLNHQEPVETAKTHFLIKVFRDALKRQGITPRYKPSFGATVLSFLQEKKIEGFSFGVGTRGCAHSADEYVKIKNIDRGVRVLKDYVQGLDEYLN